MKSIILTFLLSSLIFLNIKSQNNYEMPIDPNTGKITYKEVVEEVGSKDTLFARAYMWVKNNFPSPSTIITKKDLENGIFECMIKIKLTTTDKKGVVYNGGMVFYTLRIEIKENKYRIIATDFKKMDSSNPIESWFKDDKPEAIATHQQHFPQIDIEVKKTMESVKNAMKPTKVIKDEW